MVEDDILSVDLNDYNCTVPNQSSGMNQSNITKSSNQNMTGYWNISNKSETLSRQKIGKDIGPHDAYERPTETLETSDFSKLSFISILVQKVNKLFDDSKLLQALCGGLILLMSIAMASFVTLWPQTNIILCPDYWYEPLGIVIFGYLSLQNAATVVDSSWVMNVDILKNQPLKIFFKLFISAALGFSIPYISIYLIWTMIFEQRHPMPFIGQICGVIAYITKVICFWFIFPYELRVNNKQFRKRLTNYFVLFPLYTFNALAYSNMSNVFFIVPSNVQWCLGIVVPCLKKFNIWIASKFAFKAAGGGRTLYATLAVIMGVGTMHSLSIVLLLGSKVRPITTYLIIILDSIPNVWSCIKLIKQNRMERINTVSQLYTNDISNPEQNPALFCLTLKEFMELSIPAVYCASFLMAYYGPNAEVLGNVRNDYWQFEKVENVFEKLSAAGLFFCIDAVRGIIFALILWYASGLNMFETYCYIAHRYGFVLFLYISGALVVVNELLSKNSDKSLFLIFRIN